MTLSGGFDLWFLPFLKATGGFHSSGVRLSQNFQDFLGKKTEFLHGDLDQGGKLKTSGDFLVTFLVVHSVLSSFFCFFFCVFANFWRFFGNFWPYHDKAFDVFLVFF